MGLGILTLEDSIDVVLCPFSFFLFFYARCVSHKGQTFGIPNTKTITLRILYHLKIAPASTDARIREAKEGVFQV